MLQTDEMNDHYILLWDLGGLGDLLSLFELGLLEWDLGGLLKDNVNVRTK